MAIPASFIQDLIARSDIVEVVGQHVQLKKSGANYMGLCPFHGEKSPSFSVSPTKQFYHCFGCGASGDAIKFLMEHTGETFVEAVHDLAGQFGLQVPDDDSTPEERARAVARREKQATLSDVLAQAAAAYRQHLRGAPRAINYLKQRGVSGEIARTYGLGYAPEGWRTLASVFPDYADALLTESGLVIQREEEGSEDKRYDRFRDRVMFPIRNVKGDVIGFGGRVLDKGEPKYLNSPETPVFSKGHELYGLFEARNAIHTLGYALVTEGYMDVVALAQLGFGNAVATLGTACTADHVRLLMRFTDQVVFSFDGDGAGRRAARKALDAALPWASDTRSIKFLFLPAEHDPDSYIRAFGHEAFAVCIGEAVPLSRFLIDSAREDCDLTTAEGRARLASNAHPLWTLLPDGAFKRQLLGEFASLIQLDEAALQDLWASASSRRPGAARAPADAGHAPPMGFDGPPPDWDGHGGGHGQHRFGDRPSWRRKGKGGGDGWPGHRDSAPQVGMRLRQKPVSREDHAVRLLLADPTAWDRLSFEERAMLSALPAPHGPLFVWLEEQLHEMGAQPWAALTQAIAEQPFADLANRLMGSLPAVDDTPPEEARRELQGVLARILDEQLKREESAALQAINTDPQALARYRAINEQRKSLQTKLRSY
ncbi:MAG: DNA primase [Paracidovorax wautersii]|uniref:DNA primase n=1 Tax=Paracidovorax wautersii TaxID=1177982 RepID=A0A7V8JP17_9BURK|nr:MAG: DNA primase [Paracidovorax wautersii]